MKNLSEKFSFFLFFANFEKGIAMRYLWASEAEKLYTSLVKILLLSYSHRLFYKTFQQSTYQE